MENLYLTVIFLFTLFFLLGSGVWIGLALMGVAYVGMEMFTVRPAGDAMITTIWTTSSSWSLTALPLSLSGISKNATDVHFFSREEDITVK